jgi:hypothetical protein
MILTWTEQSCVLTDGIWSMDSGLHIYRGPAWQFSLCLATLLWLCQSYEVECKDGQNAMEVEGGCHEPRNGCYSSMRLETLRWLVVAGLLARYCFDVNEETEPG